MRLFFLAVVLWLLSSCEALLSSQRVSLSSDIAVLFAAHGIADTNPACEMMGETRAGRCLLDAQTQQVSALVSGLGLQGGSEPAVAAVNGFTRWESAAGGCRSVPDFSTEQTVVFYSDQRQPSLQLANGGQFEYLLLYYRPDLTRLCIQAEYAYG